jgi:hypothetical protein
MSSDKQPAAASLLAHGVAGAASSVAALALLYPLDQLRTLQQVDLARRACFAYCAQYYKCVERSVTAHLVLYIPVAPPAGHGAKSGVT